jgi:hypothetical protein
MLMLCVTGRSEANRAWLIVRRRWFSQKVSDFEDGQFRRAVDIDDGLD